MNSLCFLLCISYVVVFDASFFVLGTKAQRKILRHNELFVFFTLWALCVFFRFFAVSFFLFLTIKDAKNFAKATKQQPSVAHYTK